MSMKIRSMSAGRAGASVYNANVNGEQGGGNKKQGLAPTTNKRVQFVLRAIKRKADSDKDNRRKVFCINQLGGVGRPVKGRRFKCKTKKNGTIKCGPSTTKESYTRNEGRYFPFKVEFTEFEGETDFVFYGRSVSDVKIRLRSIYRPEKFDKIKITRLTPSTVLKYYWDKRQGAM